MVENICQILGKKPNHHDEIIQGLESRVTPLAKEAVTKTDKNEDYKAIFTDDGAPLYTLFYYFPEEIKYFLANSGFSDDDEFKNVTSILDKDNLLHRTIRSPNSFSQKAQRTQSNEYPKSMKDLVANKPLTMEDEDVRINRRCSTLLLNQLPPEGRRDGERGGIPGSYIMPAQLKDRL
ncbi:hypothetical protein Tco_0387227 [Tanacetum coccineum]